MMSLSPSKRANLRDVARAADVSVATVSRVLNTPEKVRKETRKRVEEQIRLLRFVPSAAARAFSTGRTRVVGALVPTLDNAVFARVLENLENGLARRGLALVVATTDDDPIVEAEKAQQLVNIGAEGMVVTGITHNKAFTKLLDRAELPVVAISYYDPSYHIPTIGYDNRESARLAMDHLCASGHRKIAVLHGPLHFSDRTRSRVDAIGAMKTDAELHFFHTDVSIEGGVRAVQQMLSAPVEFDACLCATDVIATGVLFELQRQNIKVPDDISLMGLDDLPISSFTNPTLTSVRAPVQQMGLQAADALADWIETGSRPQAICLPVTLQARQSTHQR